MSKLFSIIGATAVVLGGINAKAEKLQRSKNSAFQSRRPRFLCWVQPTSERDHRYRCSCSTECRPLQHQVAVLSPRPRIVKEMAPSSLNASLAPLPAAPRSSANLPHKE